MPGAIVSLEGPRAPGAEQHLPQPVRLADNDGATATAADDALFQFLTVVARISPDATHGERLRHLIQQESDWTALISLAERHGVMPLLCRYLITVDPGVVPSQIRELVRSRMLQCQARGLFQTGRLLQLLKVFEAQSIHVVPFKGTTLAALAYGDVTLRESSDIDLLVWPEDAGAARQALLDAGFREGFGLTERGQERCLASIGQLAYVHPDGTAVDLHTQIMPAAFGFPWDAKAAYSRRAEILMADRAVSTFSPEDTLLILAVHGAKHLWTTLGMICDIAELIRANPAMNWDFLREMAGRLHCVRMVGLALVLANEILDAPVPEHMLNQALADPQIRSLVELVKSRHLRGTKETPSGTESALFHLRARERLRDAVRYGLSLALEPTVVDWNAGELPGWMSWMYFVMRPLRLARKYCGQIFRK